uniref:Fas apoptotic inhibitory molecule b n=1 Tax=Sinocyclocheilus rhinocerous TaxID=307959 RepID=A0A673H3Q6_9TELE
MSGDIVGAWDVSLSDGVYRIEFEHGTTTGKRVIYINGKEVLRRDWMFKLVGKETFPVGSTDTKATISIEAITGFSYEYTLDINRKSLQTFLYNRSKMSKTWVLKLGGADYRVNMLCILYCPTTLETHFAVENHECCIKATSSGRKRNGIVHSLLVDGIRIEEAIE